MDKKQRRSEGVSEGKTALVETKNSKASDINLLYLPMFPRDGLGKRFQETLDSRDMSRLIFMIQHL